MPSQSARHIEHLNKLWIVIFTMSLISLLSYLFVLFPNNSNGYTNLFWIVFGFDGNDEAWSNNGGGEDISLARVYFIGILTTLLTLCISSYGFWCHYLSESHRKLLDIVFTGCISACGLLCFVSFVLFASFQWMRDGFNQDNGDIPLFLFSFSCFILSMLYVTVFIKTSMMKHKNHKGYNNNGKEGTKNAYMNPSSNLI